MQEQQKPKYFPDVSQKFLFLQVTLLYCKSSALEFFPLILCNSIPRNMQTDEIFGLSCEIPPSRDIWGPVYLIIQWKRKEREADFFFKYSEYYEGFISKTNFVFAKVDLPTFLTLTDDDLKELGIAAFGARRKMLLTIQGELLVLSLNRKWYFLFIKFSRYFSQKICTWPTLLADNVWNLFSWKLHLQSYFKLFKGS